MDTISAFARGVAAQGSQQRVFDWDKAARIINERGVIEADAGLSGDLEWTGGRIFANGAPVRQDDTYVYLSSNWATPVLIVDDEEIACWKYEKDTDGWGASTFWPPSALDILKVQS